MQLPRSTVKRPVGFSFEIPDLLLVSGWTDFHNLRLAIELDVCADGDEYEELLGVYERNETFRRWMIWRSCDAIVVQPTMGRPRLFDSVADALEMLIPSREQ